VTAKQILDNLDLIRLLPDNVSVEETGGALWLINANAAEIRPCFPMAVLWNKRHEEGFGWWYETTLPDGRKVALNTHTAPASCRAIQETYEEVEKVATAFEEKTVTKTRTRWECGPEVVTA
jgi:hypothetical protein